MYSKSYLASSLGSRLEFQLFQQPPPPACSIGTLNSTFPKLDFSFALFPIVSPLFCLHKSYHCYSSESNSFRIPNFPYPVPSKWKSYLMLLFQKSFLYLLLFPPPPSLLALSRSSPASSTWTIVMASSSTSLPAVLPPTPPHASHKVTFVRHPHALATQLLRNLR